MSFLICLFVIENTQLMKKNLKCTNCAISAFLGKWVLCFFYLFSFQFTFAQLYQSGGVAIVGISEITIVPSKDQIGNVYVSKGASIYNAENISSTKIIVLKNPQKKAIFKEELATTNKTHKSKYSKEITALEKKSNFNFIGGKSDEAFKITFEKKYIALSNTNNQSKIAVLKTSNFDCIPIFYDRFFNELIVTIDFKNNYLNNCSIRPPPSV